MVACQSFDRAESGGSMFEEYRGVIIYVLYFLMGMFFGMGVEEKLWGPWRLKVRNRKRGAGCPDPLPMGSMEMDERAD